MEPKGRTMSIPKSLEPEKLIHRCDVSQFKFKTTAELETTGEFIGQNRAVEAIQFGIGIQHEGFNLYALGPNGIGKHTLVNQFLEQKAPAEPTPDDWCYVNNFKQPHEPQALRLPAGQGNILKQDMSHLVEALITVIPTALNSDDYRTQKNAIISEQREQEVEAFKYLEDRARNENIRIVNTPSGFVFAPLKDGEVISPEEFEALSPGEQKDIETKIVELQGAMQQIVLQIPQWHRETQSKLKKLQEDTAVFVITPFFDVLGEKYAALPDVLTYLDGAKQDIVSHVEAFMETNEESLAPLVGIASSGQAKKGIFTRYQVNVIVARNPSEGAPVIYEDQPTYQNLIGRVEHVSQMGTLLTDFTLIKAGALHQANGGYLILDARKLLLQPYAWDGLKRALRAHQIHIESLGQLFGWISTVSLEPEPIPLRVKVILTGERLLYYLLNQYDPDFRELFKVAADFEIDMERDENSVLAYAHLIADLAKKEGLRHCNREAVARVIEHSSRLASDAAKLTTHMQSISDLLREANYWAGQVGNDLITESDIQQALGAQIFRSSRIRERVHEMILRDTIMIDTDGSVVGQVNGLSVITLDTYAFGRPNRITARFRLGKGEVIDIERQVEMGGPIHSKGVMILAGFLGSRYAKERPFPLSATLVFEQSYSGVEGDSASSAELYALLSALADAPLKQSLAVTGSVNQRGQVQAIGGVNEKIEGFFDLCQRRGLTGKQGVLIPQANIKHLMLRSDVVDAAASGQFHIFPVETVDQGIELLTGLPAGDPDEEGSFPSESINGRVVACLTRLAEQARVFAAQQAINGQTSENIK